MVGSRHQRAGRRREVWLQKAALINSVDLRTDSALKGSVLAYLQRPPSFSSKPFHDYTTVQELISLDPLALPLIPDAPRLTVSRLGTPGGRDAL